MVEDGDRPPGRVIHNPVSGERIEIRTSGTQTDGRMLCFDVILPPGGHVPAPHTHPEQVERFTVLAGQLRFRIGSKTLLARPGQTIAVPAGKPHWFCNAGAEAAHARVEVEPALRMEELLVASEALAHSGHLRRLSDLALVLLEFQHELGIPNVPAALARTVLAPLAWLGRRRTRTLNYRRAA